MPITTALGQEKQEQNWLIYNSSDIGYSIHSIQYPLDWDKTVMNTFTKIHLLCSLIFLKNTKFWRFDRTRRKHPDTDTLIKNKDSSGLYERADRMDKLYA